MATRVLQPRAGSIAPGHGGCWFLRLACMFIAAIVVGLAIACTAVITEVLAENVVAASQAAPIVAPSLPAAALPAPREPNLDSPQARYFQAQATEEPAATAMATAEPTATALPTATNTPLPTAIAEPTATNTPLPTATATTLPTATPPPTVAPPPPSPAAPPGPASSAPTRIVAPAIGLDAPVVEMGYRVVYVNGVAATDWQVPTNDAGFQQGSALPGHSGNTVVAGHNNVGREVFRPLGGLNAGDTVTLYVGQDAYQYVVSQRVTVQEAGASLEQRIENARWILPTDDERLTLITCWPYPASTHRLIIVAKPR